MATRPGRSRLPLLLAKRDLTQNELASRLDVTPSYISQIISGGKMFSYIRARMAAKILHCSMEDLYEWPDN